MVKNINITIPNGWNQCTTEQLEIIASVMLDESERADRYQPFSIYRVRLALFFLLAGIEIVKHPDISAPFNKQKFICRFIHKEKLRKWIRHKAVFSLYLWEVNYWLTPRAKTNDKKAAGYISQGAGLLDWVSEEGGISLTKFPYTNIKRRKAYGFSIKSFQGPMDELDGFSWEQYRFANDLMQTYIRVSNNMIRMKRAGRINKESMLRYAKGLNDIKALFLAVIFNSNVNYVDGSTGVVKNGFHYKSSQHENNAHYFNSFPDKQWQVVLFWWTGITHALSKQYPHVFKPQKLNTKQIVSTPLEIYTATTATVQKYARLTEDQINNQSYSLVLEHLERLSKENEAMEQMRKKK